MKLELICLVVLSLLFFGCTAKECDYNTENCAQFIEDSPGCSYNEQTCTEFINVCSDCVCNEGTVVDCSSDCTLKVGQMGYILTDTQMFFRNNSDESWQTIMGEYFPMPLNINESILSSYYYRYERYPNENKKENVMRYYVIGINPGVDLVGIGNAGHAERNITITVVQTYVNEQFVQYAID